MPIFPLVKKARCAMNEKAKPPDGETPEQKRLSAQFAEIGSLPKLTKGANGGGRDYDAWRIPVPVTCKWSDAKTDPEETK